MATLGSRINLGVTLLATILAGYFLWQFLAIYIDAFRFQDAVSGIAYRATEVPRPPEDLRQSVLGAAQLLHLPVNPRGVQVFMVTQSNPEIDVYYGEPMDLIVTKTYVRCHVNNANVNIWFSNQPPEQVQKESPRKPTPHKRT